MVVRKGRVWPSGDFNSVVRIYFLFVFLQQLGGACLKNHRQRLALTFRVDTFLDGIHKRIAVDVEDMGIRMSQCI